MRKDKWIEQYKSMVFDSNKSYKVIGRFVCRHFPTVLYRYRRFGNYWKDEMFKGYVHMSKSSELNDPFDCLVYVDHRRIINEEIKRRNLPGYNVLSIENDLSWEKWSTDIQNLTRIACFTENHANPLMWAHYAEGHQGFCVEYDFRKAPISWKNYIFPVIYLKEKYDATDDALESKKNNVLNPFIVKSDVWKYENEWRILWPTEKNKDNSYFNINFSQTITGIYFGVNAGKNQIYIENKREIADWAKRSNVKLFQMKIDARKYELISERIV